jgi:hypothetical protein
MHVQDILINGALFGVRANLYHFFERYVSSYMKAEYLWIDQICIDQSDVEDKSNQVAMMQAIYSKARKVVTWLGLEAVDDAYAMQAITNGEDRMSIWWEDNARAMRAVVAFFAKPYWSRLWIIQEILLAQDLELWCGELTLQWSTVIKLFHRHRRTFDFARTEEGTTISSCVRRLAMDSNYKPHRSIAESLSVYLENECFDPRDKVYGLQCVFESMARVEIDYSRSKEEVFIDTIAQTTGRRLFPLSAERLARSMTIEIPAVLRGSTYRYISDMRWRSGVNSNLTNLSAVWLRYMLADALLGDNNAYDSWFKATIHANLEDLEASVGEGLDQAYLEAFKSQTAQCGVQSPRDVWREWFMTISGVQRFEM